MRAQITVAAYFGIFFFLQGLKRRADTEAEPASNDVKSQLRYVFSVPTLVRVGTLLAGAIVPGLLMFLVPSSPYAVSCIFGALIPSWILGFCLFGVCPWLLFRWNMNLEQLTRTYKVQPDRVTSENLVVYKPGDQRAASEESAGNEGEMKMSP
jgi:hypothetical protein